HQVVGGREIGERPAGKRHQELHVDDAAAAVARAVKDLHLLRDDVEVRRFVPRLVRVPDAVPIVLFEVRQQRDEAAEATHFQVVGAFDCEAGREVAAGVVMVVQGDAELLQIVDAYGAGGGFADLLHGRHKQADQHGNNGDNNQKFDQAKGSALHGW